MMPEVRPPDLDFEPRGLLIGGEWVRAGSGRSITTINPSTGDLIGEVPLAGGADVDAAVAAAKAAFPAWAALPVTRRAEHLIRLAEEIDAPRRLSGADGCGRQRQRHQRHARGHEVDLGHLAVLCRLGCGDEGRN